MTLRQDAQAAWAAKQAEEAAALLQREQSLQTAAVASVRALLPTTGTLQTPRQVVPVGKVTLPDGPVTVRVDDVLLSGMRADMKWTWVLVWQEDGVMRRGGQVTGLAELGRLLAELGR